MIGIDVVELIVAPKTEAGSDGNEAFAPERLEEGLIEAGEIADETEAPFDFVVNHRLGTEAGGIGGGNADGRRAFGGDGGGKALVQKASEHHHGDIARLTIGYTKTGAQIAFGAQHPYPGGKTA